MAKTTSTTTVNPLVAAILAGSQHQQRASLLDRVGDVTVASATSITRFGGQVAEAFDLEHFADGRKKQRLATVQSRKAFWEDVAAQHELSEQDVAAIISAQL